MEFYYDKRERDYEKAKVVCANAGGMIFEPRNRAVTEAVSDRFGYRLGGFWLGIHKSTDDGTFVYESDGKLVEWTNWANKKSNFLANFWKEHTEKENCAVTFNGKWYVSTCEAESFKNTLCFRQYQGNSNSINIFTCNLIVLVKQGKN